MKSKRDFFCIFNISEQSALKKMKTNAKEILEMMTREQNQANFTQCNHNQTSNRPKVPQNENNPKDSK